MGLYDTIKIDKEELPELGIFKQLDLDMSNIDFQTKDLDNILTTYTFKRFKELDVLTLRDPDDNIHGITKVIEIHTSVETYDKIESYWLAFHIMIKRGVVEYIALNQFYKLHNLKLTDDPMLAAIGARSAVRNDTPLDKTITESNCVDKGENANE